MSGQTVILCGETQRVHARELVRAAEQDSVVTIRPGQRSAAQNRLMWDWLTDFEKANPQNIYATKEQWKNILLVSLGQEVKFIAGLDGQAVPDALSTSAMGVKQMADFLTHIDATAARVGVALKKQPDLLRLAKFEGFE